MTDDELTFLVLETEYNFKNQKTSMQPQCFRIRSFGANYSVLIEGLSMRAGPPLYPRYLRGQ